MMNEPEVHLCKTDAEHLDKRLDEVMAELRNINGAFARNADGNRWLHNDCPHGF